MKANYSTLFAIAVLAAACGRNSVDMPEGTDAPESSDVSDVSDVPILDLVSLTAPDTEVGSSSTLTVTVVNTHRRKSITITELLTHPPFYVEPLEAPLRIGPGQSTTIVVTFQPTSAGVFTDQLICVIERQTPRVFELAATAIAPGGSLPDVVVTAVSASPASPAADQAVTFSAVVKNQGTGATPPGTIIGVLFSVDGGAISWSDNYTTSLAAGASVTLTANGGPISGTWSATSGSHIVLANVDDIDRFAESDESNNTLSTTLFIGCDNNCAVVAQTSCTGGVLTTCSADANGCLAWSAGTSCPTGFCGNASSCGSCSNTCAIAGQTSCASGVLKTCTADIQGCLAWNAGTACSSGSCVNATSCAGSGSSGLPSGVTLQAIDGERMVDATTMSHDFYARNGFTYAASGAYDTRYSNGWDSPNFFSFGLFLVPLEAGQSDFDRWNDASINTAWGFTAPGLSTSYKTTLFRQNKMWSVYNRGDLQYLTPSADCVGISGADENGEQALVDITQVANSAQDHRFWWFNGTWAWLQPGTDSSALSTLGAMMTTPNGTQRHLDIYTIDQYFIIGGREMLHGAGDAPHILQAVYNLGSAGTSDQILRPSHYGDMIDRLRTHNKNRDFLSPTWIASEIGESGFDGIEADLPRAKEIIAHVWSQVIHGGRMILYFNHTMCGGSGFRVDYDDLADPYYHTPHNGDAISAYDAVKRVNGQIKGMATVLNSPFAMNYVSVSGGGLSGPGWSYGQSLMGNNTTQDPNVIFNGFGVMAKYHNAPGFGDGKFYVFAEARYSESSLNRTATFTLNANASGSKAHDVLENRDIPITNHQFTDTYADGTTIHVYRIDP